MVFGVKKKEEEEEESEYKLERLEESWEVCEERKQFSKYRIFILPSLVAE